MLVGTYPDEEAARRDGHSHVAIDEERCAAKHLDLSDQGDALKRGPQELKFAISSAHISAL
jgi:hypothetical protein